MHCCVLPWHLIRFTHMLLHGEPHALPHPNPTTPLIVLVWFSHGYFHFSLHRLAPYPSLAADRISSKSGFSSSTDAMRSLYSSHPEETESHPPQRTGGHAAEVTVYGEDAQSPPPHRKPRDQAMCRDCHSCTPWTPECSPV